jgi:chromosome segregation ATPase
LVGICRSAFNLEEDDMRPRDACIGAAVAAVIATGACDTSKTALDKAKEDIASVNAERDGLKAQLDYATNENIMLTAKVSDLTTRLNAATQTPVKSAKQARAGVEKAAKKVAHAPSPKSKA